VRGDASEDFVVIEKLLRSTPSCGGERKNSSIPISVGKHYSTIEVTMREVSKEGYIEKKLPWRGLCGLRNLFAGRALHTFRSAKSPGRKSRVGKSCAATRSRRRTEAAREGTGALGKRLSFSLGSLCALGESVQKEEPTGSA